MQSQRRKYWEEEEKHQSSSIQGRDAVGNTGACGGKFALYRDWPALSDRVGVQATRAHFLSLQVNIQQLKGLPATCNDTLPSVAELLSRTEELFQLPLRVCQV
jgi:hypothetical protein